MKRRRAAFADSPRRFLFFAFAGTQVANAQSKTPSESTTTNATVGFSPIVMLYISISFGFSLMVNVWIFFRISGGLFNPAVRTWPHSCSFADPNIEVGNIRFMGNRRSRRQTRNLPLRLPNHRQHHRLRPRPRHLPHPTERPHNPLRRHIAHARRLYRSHHDRRARLHHPDARNRKA